MFKPAFALAMLGAFVSMAPAQGWQCYGGNAQHTGIFTGTSQSAALIKWQTPIDDDPAFYGYAVYAHYAAPTVTPNNTVVYALRYTTSAQGAQEFDNWRVIAKEASTGQTVWQINSDFSAVDLFLGNGGIWTSVYPMTLFGTQGSNARSVAFAGAGGTVLVKNSADASGTTTTRMVFYTTLSDYAKNSAEYAPIKISTPITADNSDNLYFGYVVTGSIPSALAAKLGNGGIVKLDTKSGAATYKTAAALGVNSGLQRAALNCAPVISSDWNYVYVGMCDGGGGTPYLVKLTTKDLSTSASVHILDPNTGNPVGLIDQSSASPMIGPDGNVFYGVFRSDGWESHGWMMQFDKNLNPKDSAGKTFPAGAFGWDDTAAVVPATMVPSYKGKAKYLILTKYNNYEDFYGGDSNANGTNKVAVLDPTSNSITRDRENGTPVMNEILTVLGVTHNNSGIPEAVNEWCINSAAIDVARQGAIINSEDGHMYRWSFVTNSLVENLPLEKATSEAYTMTSIGPDGTIYVINNCELFAIGSNNATGISTIQGTGSKGSLSSVWYADGQGYSAKAVSTSSGQVVTIEADFNLASSSRTQLNISANVTTAAGASVSLFAYNYSTKAFELVPANPSFPATPGIVTGTISTGASNYFSKSGAVRIRVMSLLPTEVKTPYTFLVDEVTCGS